MCQAPSSTAVVLLKPLPAEPGAWIVLVPGTAPWLRAQGEQLGELHWGQASSDPGRKEARP